MVTSTPQREYTEQVRPYTSEENLVILTNNKHKKLSCLTSQSTSQLLVQKAATEWVGSRAVFDVPKLLEGSSLLLLER
jgi:hypothetical protein